MLDLYRYIFDQENADKQGCKVMVLIITDIDIIMFQPGAMNVVCPFVIYTQTAFRPQLMCGFIIVCIINGKAYFEIGLLGFRI